MEGKAHDDRSLGREGVSAERSAFFRAMLSRYSLPILAGVIIGLITTFLLRLAGKALP